MLRIIHRGQSPRCTRCVLLLLRALSSFITVGAGRLLWSFIISSTYIRRILKHHQPITTFVAKSTHTIQQRLRIHILQGTTHNTRHSICSIGVFHSNLFCQCSDPIGCLRQSAMLDLRAPRLHSLLGIWRKGRCHGVRRKHLGRPFVQPGEAFDVEHSRFEFGKGVVEGGI